MFRVLSVGVLLGWAALGVGCAAGADAAGGDSAADPFAVPPAPPSGDVLGQGTVLDDGDGAQLCLGPVAESYPPQCGGIALTGWDWDAASGYEESSGVRWGTYAVQGGYDGESLEVHAPPIPLALYDPMRPEDPTGGVPGEASEARLQQIQAELPERIGGDVLTAAAVDGRLWVDVVWDDGTWQAAAESVYGDDVVLVRSALQPVEP